MCRAFILEQYDGSRGDLVSETVGDSLIVKWNQPFRKLPPVFRMLNCLCNTRLLGLQSLSRCVEHAWQRHLKNVRRDHSKFSRKHIAHWWMNTVVLTGHAYLKGMTIGPFLLSTPSFPWWCKVCELPPNTGVLLVPYVQVPVGATRAWYSFRQALKKVSHWSPDEHRCPPLAWGSQHWPLCREPWGFSHCRICTSNVPTAHAT